MLLRKVVACSKAHDKGCSSLDFPRKSLDELNKVILIGAERTHAMSFFLPPFGDIGNYCYFQCSARQMKTGHIIKTSFFES